MQTAIGSLALVNDCGGHSTNLAKLYTTAAFNWYSSTSASAVTAQIAPIVKARTRNIEFLLLPEPYLKAEIDGPAAIDRGGVSADVSPARQPNLVIGEIVAVHKQRNAFAVIQTQAPRQVDPELTTEQVIRFRVRIDDAVVPRIQRALIGIEYAGRDPVFHLVADPSLHLKIRHGCDILRSVPVRIQL